MEVNVRNVEDVIILDFSGVWEREDSAETSRSMRHLLDLGYRCIILNFSDIGMLPRKAVSLIHSFYRDAEKQGCRVRIVAPSTQVRGMLRSGGFLGSTDVYRDEIEALKGFR